MPSPRIRRAHRIRLRSSTVDITMRAVHATNDASQLQVQEVPVVIPQPGSNTVDITIDLTNDAPQLQAQEVTVAQQPQIPEARNSIVEVKRIKLTREEIADKLDEYIDSTQRVSSRNQEMQTPFELPMPSGLATGNEQKHVHTTTVMIFSGNKLLANSYQTTLAMTEEEARNNPELLEKLSVEIATECIKTDMLQDIEKRKLAQANASVNAPRP